ncbi:MAG: helix-turn-helix domain-containing protein [Pseudomonadota bacterium]
MELDRRIPDEESVCEVFGSIGDLASAADQSHVKRGDVPLLVRVTTQIVAVAFNIDQTELVHTKRGTTKISRARQISAYLLNTTLSLSLVDIGRLFGKDRTTIGYACRLIEDLRDDPAFDDRIAELEKTILLVMDLANKKL